MIVVASSINAAAAVVSRCKVGTACDASKNRTITNDYQSKIIINGTVYCCPVGETFIFQIVLEVVDTTCLCRGNAVCVSMATVVACLVAAILFVN